MDEIVGSKDYADLIGIRAEGVGGKIEVHGMVFSDGSVRVVKLDDYSIDMHPSGVMLFIENTDRPGVIGRVCTALGENGVNIAEMHNIRHEKGEEAMTVIRIDGDAADGLVREIGRVDGVTRARRVIL